MSHFSVAVRVPGSVALSKVESHVRAMLIPYKESGCGDDDPPELKKHLEFHDTEDEYKAEYETEGVEMVELPDGGHVTWDERFRVSGSFGTGSDTHKVPDGLRTVEVKHKDRYASLEVFAKEWHGTAERDPKTKRFGYWQNPQKKWDWYQIGGRWSGKFRVRPASVVIMGERSWANEGKKIPDNRADVCRIRDLDWDTIAVEARDRTAEFWQEWRAFLAGKQFPAFEGPRESALDLGWLECKDETELTGSEFWKEKWSRQNTPGVNRFDVVTAEPKEAEWTTRLLAHFNPIRPWGFMDADGWRERGRMGWFGSSDATPDTTKKNEQDFFAWVRSGDASDWIVCVDCHI